MSLSKLITIFILTFSINFLNANEIKKGSLLCNTIEECEKLSISIQSKIKEIENTNDPDFDKLDELQNQLIAVENSKQEKMRDAQDKKIEEVKGILLSK